jgi:hypothetical protein
MSLSEYRTDLPLAVNVVLQKAMAKNPHERYPTVQSFSVDLLEASQEITQQLVKPSISAPSPITRIRPVPDNAQANEKELVELQPVAISLANTPATDPIAIPIIPAPTKHTSRNQEGKYKAVMHEVTTAIPEKSRSSNRWIWCALILNVFICLMLITEYSLVIGTLSFSFRSLVTLCPALLVGLLLAQLFKRISLTSLSWSLFWGIFFGMTNALLSLLACMVWYSLLLIVPFQGSTGEGLSGFFGPSLPFDSEPRIVVLLLLALWVSVTGGAIIGIINMQGEGTTRTSHPGPQKQSSGLKW